MKPTSIPRVSLTKSVLNRFTSVIHPPLPLSPLESRKFLTLIKDSFRTQLAAATPTVTPTEQHFSQVFAAAQTSGVPAIDGLSKEERIQKFLEDPLGVFNEQVLLGKASLDLAAVCLMKHAKLQQAAKMSAGTAAAAAEKSQEAESATAVVLEGLRRANLGAPAEVLKHEKLIQAVAYALIIEGRENVIVRWARSTRKEAALVVRQNILRQGVYFMKIEHGWMRAADMFRQVLGGSRESQGRFSHCEHCTTGLKLCEMGVEAGLAGTPEFARLIRSSMHWAVHWQQQAAIHLKYAKMTGVGVRYFYDLSKVDENFWQNQKSFWYHQNSKLAMGLALECLAQNQVKEAEMITEIVRRRFVGKVQGLDLEDVGVNIDAGRAAAEKIRQESANGEHRSDLQGILNALG